MNNKNLEKQFAFFIYHREYNPDEPFSISKEQWDKMLAELDNKDNYWGDGKHMGDCTNEPNTCIRCLVEDCLETAKFYLKLLELIGIKIS